MHEANNTELTDKTFERKELQLCCLKFLKEVVSG